MSKKNLLENYIATVIRSINESDEKWLTVTGKTINAASEDSYYDLIQRLEDAKYYRDQSGKGSADRIHYNGLLALLRKKIKSHPLHNKLTNRQDR
jgi:hypothetical protein